MEWIIAIVVGALVGWLASLLAGEGQTPLVPAVLLGILGAVGGDWVSGVLGLASEATPARWLLSAIGAAVVIGVVRALGGLRRPLRPA
ncbi:MAG TPA: GlsB/YeaQ/YmgE family stress response membrane protein [Vicinamibacteria bacterium]|nr:GlsB/YeaQ/YmgE family stress response membrane protein [Vicinamibacteria bacterium]